MFEKEFMDEKDMLVSHVWKYDSSHGNLNYCGILCLQVNEMNTWVSVPWVGVGGQVDCFIDLVFIVVRGQLLWWEVVWFGDRLFLVRRSIMIQNRKLWVPLGTPVQAGYLSFCKHLSSSVQRLCSGSGSCLTWGTGRPDGTSWSARPGMSCPTSCWCCLKLALL